MPASQRRIDFTRATAAEREELLARQWLVTNGLGGFASGTLAGCCTWRYHGLLIAALPVPLGRTMMLNHLDEYLCLPDGTRRRIDGSEGATERDAMTLAEFRLENQIPHWRYTAGGVAVEKRILMPNLQNTVHITYRLAAPLSGARLELRPALQFRPFEAPVSTAVDDGYEVRCHGRRIEVAAPDGMPPLRLYIAAPEAHFVAEAGSNRELLYARDAERGYDARGRLWSPGYFSLPIDDAGVTLIASTEDWRTLLALSPEDAFATENIRIDHLLHKVARATESGPAVDLTVAADQFLIAPRGRVRDAARARAAGNELRSVIAGYHWFTDWGRDTMISLEGLALATGRHQEAAWILHTFARAVQDGLIPNLFPEGESKGLYHTADATLWFFHAVQRYVAVTRDRDILVTLLPILREIAEHHERGTRYGIGVDAADGLLRQGEEGYQLTWMDAKVGDWVVTPRRGKAVEINALWYNALRVLERFLRDAGDVAGADHYGAAAARAAAAFNHRFWNESAGCLFDVVDGMHGDDPAVRPNQLLAVSLPHPVLDPARWPAVLEVVERELLTPVGLRTLSPRHPDYKPRYSGDLRARDAAYHQGTVWPWLLGPFIDAWLKVHSDRARARRFLDGVVAHLDDAGIGSISEIFDAEAPFAPRGCIAQAWSVAEVLRTLLLTGERRDGKS
jgi:predicted glycogen debranching enzyme